MTGKLQGLTMDQLAENNALLKTENRKLQEQVKAIESKTSMTMGVGDGSGKLFVHGDYDSIKAAQAIVLGAELARKERDALQEQVQKLAAENSTLIGWIEMDTMTSIDRTAFSATEAVIREIGAKAVEQLSREAYENGAYGVAMIATQFAAQLLAGEQP